MTHLAGFDDSTGEAGIAVLGDGFVRLDGERVPLEAAVLTLRQRVRVMDEEELSGFVVKIAADPVGEEAAVSERISAGVNRLMSELQIMGVLWVRYL
ncbi:MAG: hypothetical protein KDC98_05765 [Planctomycetes bacterium]|nr:hypothetical protein [Planctomycetota bacterium]